MVVGEMVCCCVVVGVGRWFGDGGDVCCVCVGCVDCVVVCVGDWWLCEFC